MYSRCFAFASLFLFSSSIEAGTASLIGWEHPEDGYTCEEVENFKDISVESIYLTENIPYIFKSLYTISDSSRCNLGPHRLNNIYNPRGQILKTIKIEQMEDTHPYGYFLKNPSLKFPDLFYQDNIISCFDYNDPYQDLVKNKHSAVCESDEFAKGLIDYSTLRDHNSFPERWFFAKAESNAGVIDYFPNISGGSFLGLGCDLYIIDGRAYNRYDAGNFLWGVSMRILGFSWDSVVFGSEWNGSYNTIDTVSAFFIIKGDSDKDQQAIRNGYFSNKF